MLTRAHRQEALSLAYVEAVIACAGLSTSRPKPDYGIDFWLHEIDVFNRRRIQAFPALGVQLKSTTRATVGRTVVQYDMDVKAYEMLRRSDANGVRVLFLVTLPADEADWVEVVEGKLTVRGSGYWASLRGMPLTTARRTVRVSIPRTQVLTVAAVTNLVRILKRGSPL